MDLQQKRRRVLASCSLTLLFTLAAICSEYWLVSNPAHTKQPHQQQKVHKVWHCSSNNNCELRDDEMEKSYKIVEREEQKLTTRQFLDIVSLLYAIMSVCFELTWTMFQSDKLAHAAAIIFIIQLIIALLPFAIIVSYFGFILCLMSEHIWHTVKSTYSFILRWMFGPTMNAVCVSMFWCFLLSLLGLVSMYPDHHQAEQQQQQQQQQPKNNSLGSLGWAYYFFSWLGTLQALISFLLSRGLWTSPVAPTLRPTTPQRVVAAPPSRFLVIEYVRYSLFTTNQQ